MIISYTYFIDDPINSLVSLLIAGSIPNTNIALGLWPSLVLAGILLLLTRQIVKHIKFKILEQTAHQIKEERLKKSFEEKNDAALDKSKRSVIAAIPKTQTSSN